MYKKIAVLVLTSCLLFSCQQAITQPIEEAYSELGTARMGDLNKSPEDLSDEVHIKQLSFIATVKYLNLEGGFFGLVSKEGKHWLPVNLKKEFHQDGAVIKVSGNAVEGLITIQQWGKPFSITHIELIKAGQNGIEKNLH
jgi:hypothetical protein